MAKKSHVALRTSPTKSEYWSTSKVDDYYLKEWITQSSLAWLASTKLPKV
jgi:hypothetical protein